MSYSELNEHFDRLENLLSPASIVRDFPEIVPDYGKPLAPGLRSVARITNGIVKYTQNSAGLAALNEIQTTIVDGGIERDEDNWLVAYLNTVAPTRSMQNLNERLGLSSFEMYSVDSKISQDKDNPTSFIYSKTIVFPQGERLLDVNTWSEVVLPANLSCTVKSIATGHIEEHRFHGTFSWPRPFAWCKTRGPNALV